MNSQNVFQNEFVIYDEQIEAGNEVAKFADEFTEKGIYYEFRKLYLVCFYGLYPLGLISIAGGLMYVANLLNLPYYLSYPIAVVLLALLELLYNYTLSIVLKGAFIQRYSFLFQVSIFAFLLCLGLSVFTTSQGIYIFAKQYESETSKVNFISLDSIAKDFDAKKAIVNQKYDVMRDSLQSELKKDALFYAYDVAKGIIKQKSTSFDSYESLRKNELENIEKQKIQSLEKSQKENDLLKMETKQKIETNTFHYVWLVIICELFKFSFIFIVSYYRFKSAKQGLTTQTVPKPKNLIPIHSTFRQTFEHLIFDIFKKIGNENLQSEIQPTKQVSNELQEVQKVKQKVGFQFKTENSENLETKKVKQEKNEISFDDLKKFFDKNKYKGEYQNLFVALVAKKLLNEKIDASNDSLAQRFKAKINLVNDFRNFVEKTDIETLKNVSKPYLNFS